MILKTIAALAAVGMMVGAGWGANKYLDSTFAPKDAVKLAETKLEKVQAQVNYTQDRQMRALERDIGRLEDKPNKKPDDLETLRYMRETLKEMREVRSGKK